MENIILLSLLQGKVKVLSNVHVVIAQPLDTNNNYQRLTSVGVFINVTSLGLGINFV